VLCFVFVFGVFVVLCALCLLAEREQTETRETTKPPGMVPRHSTNIGITCVMHMLGAGEGWYPDGNSTYDVPNCRTLSICCGFFVEVCVYTDAKVMFCYRFLNIFRKNRPEVLNN
jgi:hypothetical protein